MCFERKALWQFCTAVPHFSNDLSSPEKGKTHGGRSSLSHALMGKGLADSGQQGYVLYVSKAVSRPQNSISASVNKRGIGEKVQVSADRSQHCRL